MRLLDRVPPRYRLIVRLLIVAFVLFEIARIWVLRDLWLPFWQEAAGGIAAMLRQPPLVAAVSLFVTALAFTIPMAGAVFALRYVSRKWTLIRTKS